MFYVFVGQDPKLFLFKNEDDLKNEALSLEITFFFLMTSHRDSHTTTDVKPEMIPDV